MVSSLATALRARSPKTLIRRGPVLLVIPAPPGGFDLWLQSMILVRRIARNYIIGSMVGIGALDGCDAIVVPRCG